MAPITATMADNGKSQDLVAILDAGAQYGKVIIIDFEWSDKVRAKRELSSPLIGLLSRYFGFLALFWPNYCNCIKMINLCVLTSTH